MDRARGWQVRHVGPGGSEQGCLSVCGARLFEVTAGAGAREKERES